MIFIALGTTRVRPPACANAMTVQTDADSLPLIKKVELFEYAMENTTGQDLYKACKRPDQDHLRPTAPFPATL